MTPEDRARWELAKRAYEATRPSDLEVQTGVRRTRLSLGRTKQRRKWAFKGLVLVVLALGSLAYAKPNVLGELADGGLSSLRGAAKRGPSSSAQRAPEAVAAVTEAATGTSSAELKPTGATGSKVAHAGLGGVEVSTATITDGAATPVAKVTTATITDGAATPVAKVTTATITDGALAPVAPVTTRPVAEAAIGITPAPEKAPTTSERTGGTTRSPRTKPSALKPAAVPTTADVTGVTQDATPVESAVSEWGRVGQALARGDEGAALSALDKLSSSEDLRTRDKADLGRAQLMMAHGQREQACSLARSLTHRRAGGHIERQALMLLKNCAR